MATHQAWQYYYEEMEDSYTITTEGPVVILTDLTEEMALHLVDLHNDKIRTGAESTPEPKLTLDVPPLDRASNPELIVRSEVGPFTIETFKHADPNLAQRYMSTITSDVGEEDHPSLGLLNVHHYNAFEAEAWAKHGCLLNEAAIACGRDST